MAKNTATPLYRAYQIPVFLLACLLVLAANLASIMLLNLDNSWSHGFAHPLEGWDHIVTMIAVGIWAAQLRGHAVWLLPLVFVGVMSIGGIAGTAGILIPAAEGVILLSCAVFTFFIIHRIKFSSRTNLVIVAFFAFFHGFAHGQEISASASLLSYSIGFMLATLLLHGAGILIAKLVLLCVTFLFALLLPTLAQAAQTKLADQAGSKKLILTTANNDLGSIGYTATDVFHDGLDRVVQDDLALYKRRSPGNIIPDNPSSGTQKLKRQTLHADPPVAGKIAKLENVTGNFLVLNQAIINPQAEGFGHFLPINQDNGPGCAACFKHFYPDINYTPGQILLSNGVGLTSPPLLSVVIARSSNRSCRRTEVSQAPSTDGCFLQQIKPQLAVAFAVTHSKIPLTCLKSRHAFPTLFSAKNLNLKTVSAFFPSDFYRFDRPTDKAHSDFRPNNAAHLSERKDDRLTGEFLQSSYTTLRGNHV